MNFHRLRYFSTVARFANFRRAAETLNISQPALSRQIQILEHEIGTPLFFRVSKRISLTPAGELLFSRCTAILDDVTRLREEIRDLSDQQTMHLSVGAIQSTLHHAVPRAIGRVRTLHPKARITVRGSRSEEIIERVSRGQIDIGIVGTPVSDPRIATSVFVTERYYVVMNGRHRFAGRRGLHLSDLAGEPLVMFSSGFPIRDAIDAAARSAGTELSCAIELESIAAIKALVAEGACISILPMSAIADYTEADDIRSVPVDSAALIRSLISIRLAEHQQTALSRDFVSALKEVYSAQAA